jgi:hypothetical protein
MYANKLVLAVKASGKVLREIGDQVFIPFGSEYSLLLKNLHDVKVSVKVFVDGRDATDGVSLVLNPKEQVELERFINKGNLSKGNRFKFVKSIPELQAHRGSSAEDGLIRVEFKIEKPKPTINITSTITPWMISHAPSWNGSSFHSGYPNGVRSSDLDSIKFKGIDGSTTGQYLGQISNTICNAASSISGNAVQQSLDSGVTVPGSISSQEFQVAAPTEFYEYSNTIVLRMVGEVERASTSTYHPVTAPVTVKTRTGCPSCGLKVKPSSRFCSRCGSAIEIV